MIGFALALLFLKEFRGRGIVTLFFLLPMMVVPAVSGFIFFMIFQVDGPLNQALAAILGHDVGIHWLDDPSIVIWSAITADIWQWTPLMFLILLSGLVALPEDQMNQARILGAASGTVPLPRAADAEADHPDRADHPRDRGLQGLRLAYLMTQGGPGTRRRRSPSSSTER